MIRVICLGKLKEKYLIDAVQDYYLRINKYHKFEIIELKDNENIFEEEKQLLKYINQNDFNVVLDINSTLISSEDFAKLIDKKLMEKGNINFIIGSSNGISELIKSRVNLLLSFGMITMPHALFRIVLLEQIYRSFKILNNEKYHK